MIHNPRTLTDAYERARIKNAAMRHSQGQLECKMAKLIELQEAQLQKSKATEEKTIALMQESRNTNVSPMNTGRNQPNDSLKGYSRNNPPWNKQEEMSPPHSRSEIYNRSNRNYSNYNYQT